MLLFSFPLQKKKYFELLQRNIFFFYPQNKCFNLSKKNFFSISVFFNYKIYFSYLYAQIIMSTWKQNFFCNKELWYCRKAKICKIKRHFICCCIFLLCTFRWFSKTINFYLYQGEITTVFRNYSKERN